MFYILEHGVKDYKITALERLFMKEPKEYLGHFEEIVLLAILQLKEDAYGAKIRQKVSEATERDVSIGAIYATLDRVERKGFISSWQGEATPERGGRAKRYFKVIGAGMQALNDTNARRNKLTAGLNLGFDAA
jgi:PadR family transcriptional regulator, regulatory protein PadR